MFRVGDVVETSFGLHSVVRVVRKSSIFSDYDFIVSPYWLTRTEERYFAGHPEDHFSVFQSELRFVKVEIV